jgi:hypothetical protein
MDAASCDVVGSWPATVRDARAGNVLDATKPSAAVLRNERRSEEEVLMKIRNAQKGTDSMRP